jgi:hypothetical protein
MVENKYETKPYLVISLQLMMEIYHGYHMAIAPLCNGVMFMQM